MVWDLRIGVGVDRDHWARVGVGPLPGTGKYSTRASCLAPALGVGVDASASKKRVSVADSAYHVSCASYICICIYIYICMYKYIYIYSCIYFDIYIHTRVLSGTWFGVEGLVGGSELGGESWFWV